MNPSCKVVLPATGIEKTLGRVLHDYDAVQQFLTLL